MWNQTIALNTLIIWALWVGGAAVIAFDIWRWPNDDLGFVGMAMIAGAVMRHVCCLMGRLEKREARAFELGRESGVRSLR